MIKFAGQSGHVAKALKLRGSLVLKSSVNCGFSVEKHTSSEKKKQEMQVRDVMRIIQNQTLSQHNTVHGVCSLVVHPSLCTERGCVVTPLT